MSKKSKVERSQHYDDIVDKLNQGCSCRDISDWLLEKHNEKINYQTICSFRKKLNAQIEKEVAILKEERKTVNAEAVEHINGKAKILLICEDLFNEIPSYIKKINWEEMTNRDIIELMKVLKDIAKMRLDFAKSNEVEINVNNNTFESYFNDDLLREIVDGKEGTD